MIGEAHPSIRPAAVAGQFYPGGANELARLVDRLLAAVPNAPAEPPKALIVPHAGLVYSGPIAATAYARLAAGRDRIRRVVLLGPSHRVAFRGMAVPGWTRFRTPLGDIAVDQAGIARALEVPDVAEFDAAHVEEHSLEVQLPFLQRVLGDFRLVPVVVGEAAPEAVVRLLAALWGGEETLIVISSDLSHYLPQDQARRRDAATARAIARLDATALTPEDACGCRPVAGLLQVAKAKGIGLETLDLRTSGDTAGPSDRVVGYGAWASVQDGRAGLGRGDRRELLALAGDVIRHGLAHGALPEIAEQGWTQALLGPGAAFVSLHVGAELTGCIGSLTAHRPLYRDVAENAFAAAFRDPRFASLSEPEVADLEIEISVLSPPEPIEFAAEADLLARLRPGVHGLILRDGACRGTFLPVVWRATPTPEEFLAQLKDKADLPATALAPSVRAWRYTTDTFAEIFAAPAFSISSNARLRATPQR